MRTIGLDLASGKTGLVLLEGNGTPKPTLLVEEIVSPKKALEGMNRFREIATLIMETIHSWEPERIVVEGYSLNTKNTSSIVPLVEVGAVIRLMLNLDGFKWLDPRAPEVKKFASGKGNTPKTMMPAHVLQRWGHMPKDDNTADAYVLACMGLAHANKLPGVNKEQRAIVGKLAYRVC